MIHSGRARVLSGRAGALNGRARVPTGRAGVLAAAAALTLGACDFPTEPPKFQSRFVVPGQSTSLSVNQLLPSSIAVVGDAFFLSIEPQVLPSRTLGQMCPPCQALQGQTVPKPAFNSSVQVSLAMPADVSSATVASGAVTISMTHNFGFDPLRPPGAVTNGSLVLTVHNGARVLGSTTVTDAFPHGVPLTRTVALAPGEVSGDLLVTVGLNSPAGGTAPQHWVTVNTNATLTGTVSPHDIGISSARVAVNNRQVSVTSVSIDLTGFEDLSDRVKSGALLVNMTNPFNIIGTMTLTLTGGTAGPITKAVNVAAGNSTQRIQFGEAELQSILGSTVQLTITGPVSAGAGGATIAPGDQITIETLLDLLFEIGVGDDN